MMSTPARAVPALAALPLLLSACIEEAPLPITAVVVTGGHGVVVGETLALAADTENGGDEGYRWSSGDEAIATVDQDGLVRGVSEGETLVSATGQQSGLVGNHPVVVIRPEPPPPVSDSDVPQEESWSRSGHADPTSAAFTHWDEDGAVPTSCARCHSTEGYRDYLGADGTAPGSVESAAPTGSLVRCSACHNDAAEALTSVTFPSGVVIQGLGKEARCMVCHQGRASGADVDESIAASGLDDDEASGELSFTNIHYYPAAATLFAGRAEGGYQYEGHVYDSRFRHVSGFDTCIGCHEPHSTEVRYTSCVSCHDGASDVMGARAIRMIASRGQDYDGDNDKSEGIFYELDGLKQQLGAAVRRYASERGNWLCYDGERYPYWFVDLDQDGACSPDEATYPNRYASFTPRLLKATYNFQLASKDKGAFAHNAKYVIQLLYDSLLSVNEALVVPIDATDLVRTDTGHFNGAGRAARYWDKDESVNASCSRCHSGAEGYRFFVQYGVGLEVPETANGLECATCHTSFGTSFDLLAVEKTHFPGGKVLALDGDDNLCANCHSGRASTATLDAAFAAGGALSFQNVHYLPAAGTLYGGLAKVGYQYEGKSYAGKLSHSGGTRCTTCHAAAESQHTFRIKDAFAARCDVCHGDADEAREIRLVHTADYDGDGRVGEPLADEIEGMAAKLLAALNAVGGVCYASSAYPYFFVDENASGGACEPGESVYAKRFTQWTPALLKAAHNYQLSRTEPGAWAHNFDYMAQLLFDSVEDLTGDSQNLTRP